ncbi:MAG: periplasmic heavy metal sensor [Verrucomicrobiales bacterium]|nr:periplasmic heavy metal sensor [Verrucomicrobiales bacterium]
MRRPWMLLPVGLGLGVVGFALAYWLVTHEPRSRLRSPQAELAWLQHEFQLTPAQFEKVTALHEAYRPRCAELCRRIHEQNRRLEEAALRTNAPTTELRSLVLETGRARDECRQAMLEHLYAVSREMPPEAASRYLRLMLSSTCVIEDARNVHQIHTDGTHAAGSYHE